MCVGGAVALERAAGADHEGYEHRWRGCAMPTGECHLPGLAAWRHPTPSMLWAAMLQHDTQSVPGVGAARECCFSDS